MKSENDILSDDEAREYIEFLEKYEGAILSLGAEENILKSLDTNDSEAVFNIYGHFAAMVAKDWYLTNAKQNDIRLGSCLRAANTGLLHALQLYRLHKRNVPFRYYAKPIILKELENL